MKRGFTLIELLVVIAVIGILALIAIPATINVLNDSIDSTMEVQENEVESAAILYLEDYCKSPIDTTIMCPLNRTITDGIASYSGEVDLSVLVTNEYIDEITVRDQSCAGTIIYENNKAKVYLSCGDVYKTEGYDEINNNN